jgi:hypothetical protein
MAICDRRRSLGIRPSRGEPLLLADDRRDSAAFILAAAASEVEERRGRGEGEDCLGESDNAACIDRGWDGEEAMARGGRELRSGML